MQEDYSTIDERIRFLQNSYDGLLERLRALAAQNMNEQVEAQMGAAIEGFINQAIQVNIKGGG